MSSVLMNETAPEMPEAQAAGAGSSYYAEDGWVFREFPGKRIECVGRYEDLKGELKLDHAITHPHGHHSLRMP
jgi:hypothetical protein